MTDIGHLSSDRQTGGQQHADPVRWKVSKSRPTAPLTCSSG